MLIFCFDYNDDYDNYQKNNANTSTEALLFPCFILQKRKKKKRIKMKTTQKIMIMH